MNSAMREHTEMRYAPFSEEMLNNTSEEIYKKILQCLNNRIYLDKNLSLSKFSAIVGTNTTYLSNAVNRLFGCNLRSLLNWYRVQYAKDILLKHTYSLREIPFVCGFSSKSTFYVSFKKCEGITPNQYIHQAGNDGKEQITGWRM